MQCLTWSVTPDLMMMLLTTGMNLAASQKRGGWIPKSVVQYVNGVKLLRQLSLALSCHRCPLDK